MTNFRYPAPEELSALERAARRERAEELARLTRAAIGSIKSLLSRHQDVPMKGARHA